MGVLKQISEKNDLETFKVSWDMKKSYIQTYSLSLETKQMKKEQKENAWINTGRQIEWQTDRETNRQTIDFGRHHCYIQY